MEAKNPFLIRKNPFGHRGNYYIGDSDSSSKKTPIVFVHGLHSHPEKWFMKTNYYGNNDMYQLAAYHGHPTAFVDLSNNRYGIRENGQLLGAQLKEIFHRFGQNKLAVVAHSKGGVDAQSAMIHYQGHMYVKSLTTLGSPHYGSPLADLAFSPKAKALARMAGFYDKGTYQMQTGFMEKFRSEMDKEIDQYSIPHFALVGVDNVQHSQSILSMGGKYLNQYGENDGVVVAQNAYLPYSKKIMGYWNHDNIRLGKVTFPLIEELVEGNYTYGKYNRMDHNVKYAGGSILEGGYIGFQPKVIEIYVPSSEREFWLQFLSSSEKIEVQLVAPDGKKENFEYRGLAADMPLFSGTHFYDLQWANPKEGKWTVHIKGRKGAAFFLISSYSSMKQEVIKLQSTDFCKNIANVQVKAPFPDYLKANQSVIQMFTDASRKNKYPSAQIKKVMEIKKTSHGEALFEFKLPRKGVVQTVHLRMNGESKYGGKITRDFVTSIFL